MALNGSGGSFRDREATLALLGQTLEKAFGPADDHEPATRPKQPRRRWVHRGIVHFPLIEEMPEGVD